MTQQDVSQLPPLSVWYIEQLRLTAFSIAPLSIDSCNWWSKIMGFPPESTVVQERKGERKDEGAVDSEKLVLKVEPARVDWLLMRGGDKTPGDEDFLKTAPFPKALNSFLTLMQRWFELGTCPRINRLAFGAVLLQPVADREIGYRLLSSYLPVVKLDPKGSSDFFYQINRPRDSKSGILGLRINRLSKWSVAGGQRFHLSIEGEKVVFIAGDRRDFACRLELDVNTVQDFQGKLLPSQCPLIFNELVELGKEIVENGDIS